MPILDIQSRFRELGRIRTGQKVPTAKGKMRPEKLARFRLTSPWEHLIRQAADVYGGEARPWDNDGAREFEVIVEDESLPIVIPPGDVMEQWYELWSGGGCQRRCDGVRQVLVDRPCACPADPIERQAAAGSLRPTACKPTTRLRVMLPDVADVGIWRLESHGFHAAAELGGAVGLIEAATRSGAMIPADLRLAAREGARRPGEATKKFFVPAISFRGTLGPVLDALGILEDGAVMPRILGVEARPEISSGGAPALPAGGTAFDPAPVESASFPAPALEPPPEPAPPAPMAETAVDEPTGFAPPPPPSSAPPAPLPEPEPFEPPPAPAPTADEETGGASYTGPQIIAMKFQERGIKDRGHRLALAGWLCHRPISSGNDLTPQEIRILIEILNDDAGFAELLAEVPPPDGAETAGSGAQEPPPAPPEEPGTSGAEAPEVLRGELVDDGPRPGRRRAVAPPVPTGGGDTATPSSDQGWRVLLADRGVKVTEVIREAARLAGAAGTPAPANLEQISSAPFAADLVTFVETLAASRESGR